MTVDTQGPQLLDGKATARQIRDEITAGCAMLEREHGIRPGLTVLLVGEDPASQIYVRNKAKQATEAGMQSSVERHPASLSESDLLARVAQLNADPSVHGILVQLPLPGHIDDQRVIEAIAPQKDVDGFHPETVGRMTIGLPGFLPCTPAGVIELLKRHEISLQGRHAVVLGRSNIVGKPMALLLLREHCTVTVCHSRSQNLPQIAASADLLIAAVGRRAMVTREFIRPGAVVVDVGIHRVESLETARELYGDDPKRLGAVERRGSTLVGDVHPLHANERAGWFSPVPGGVGPLTIAMLLHNTLQSARTTAGG